MPIAAKQIEYLSRTIVNRLEDRGVMEFTDAEIGIDVVTRCLARDFRRVEAVMREAREQLAGKRKATESELEAEMSRIADARSVIL